MSSWLPLSHASPGRRAALRRDAAAGRILLRMAPPWEPEALIELPPRWTLHGTGRAVYQAGPGLPFIEAPVYYCEVHEEPAPAEESTLIELAGVSAEGVDPPAAKPAAVRRTWPGLDDDEYLAAMQELLHSGAARSVRDAARQVAERAGNAGGAGTVDSTATRLQRKFKNVSS